MSLETRTIKVLGPAGTLSRAWPAFEPREGQLDMAAAAARALETRGRLVVEAGTGIGKTMAYLVPVILSEQRTIISTATKNLQDQIYEKDVPFAADHLGRRLDVCLVKGRRNYLCRRRFDQARIKNRIDPFLAVKLAAWAEVSPFGDRAEVDFLGENDPVWLHLIASSEQCLGSECDQFNDCFVTALRRRAAKARIVVANHHLFMADLALKQNGRGQVLPESEAVVFDEAHELEQAASNHFTAVTSDLKLYDLLADLAETLPTRQTGEMIPVLERAVTGLFRLLTRPGERYPLTDRLLTKEVDQAAVQLADLLEGAAETSLNLADDEGQGLAARCYTARDDLNLILGRLEPGFVYYAQRLTRGLSLKAAPVEVAELLGRLLFKQARAFVFTSATLDPVRTTAALGLPGPVDQFSFASPFDYENNSRLYVPRKMPLPNSPDFPEAAAEEMARLVELTRGRAFLLFTSRRNLDAVHAILSQRLAFPCLKQGQAPKVKLVQDFIAQPGSVLFATASFWQGVDVPGPALSLVAIDKLPFAPPDDPITAARIDRLKSLGREPFREFQLPEAALTLRQGLGRLIRSRSDRGVLALLDVRLVTKGYGKTIQRQLPPSPVVRDIDLLRDWVDRELGLAEHNDFSPTT